MDANPAEVDPVKVSADSESGATKESPCGIPCSLFV
jgi:hypothetical protein